MGCAANRAAVEPPPAALLTCAPSPEPPERITTQRDVAGFIVDLYAAGDDCRSKLGAVATYLGVPADGA